MEPDTAKIWTRPEVQAGVGKLIVESLGIDEAKVTSDAALVRDLGAESIDFLDLSFKCQQTFGVDLPMRLIQERRIEWRDLSVLAGVLQARYQIAVAADELRRILADLAPTPLDLSDLTVDRLARYLEQNLHSSEAVEVVMNRLTVRAITEYLVKQLAAAGRLAPGT